MRRTGELVRALSAAVALAAVVVGLPVVLAVAVGWPLPRALPRLAQVGETLTGDRPLETGVVWKALALVVWLAWAQVATAALAEATALVRHGLPRVLPGLGLAHGVVAPLVAAVVLALPSGRATAHPGPAAAVVVAPPAPPEPPEDEPPGAPVPEASAPATVEHVVVRGDNLWDLAERYLGDGHRAGELFEANRGRPQPDGRALVEPGMLHPGWVLRVPAPPIADGASVTVAPGDTLSALAGRHLGDPARYGEFVALNAGRPQPDGRALVDPDLIRPGWVLRLPAPTDAVATAPPSAPPDASPLPPDEPASDPDPLPPEADVAVEATPSERVGTGAAAEDSRASAEAEPARPPAAPVGLLAGGLGTAGLLAVVERRRRAQQRRRCRGERPAPAEPVVAEAERALRAGADRAGAALVDVALRAAAAACTAGGLPALRWVEAGAASVTLVVDDDLAAPPGFVADGLRRWRTAASPARLAAVAQGRSAPAPALTPVGRTGEGVELLVDLEAAGVVAVAGDPEARTRLLRAMAVSLAASLWSDGTRVLAVGAAGALSSVSDVEVVASLDAALEALEERAEAVARSLAAVGCATTAQARASGVTPDAWIPTVVVSTEAPHELQLRRLAALGRRGSCGIAVVVPAPTDGVGVGRLVTVGADGSARVGDAGPELTACSLSEDDVEAAAAVLADTDRPAAPPADVDRSRPRLLVPKTVEGGLAALLAEVDLVVRVLGEVELVRLTAEGEQRVKVPRQKSQEAVVYLARRDGPVDGEALQAALWPAGTNAAKTFNNTVWEARRALGCDRDGALLLPEPVEGRYDVGARVVTDYWLFHQLVIWAEATEDPETAAGLLAEALTLVRGEPFTGVGRAYAWVAPHTGMIVAQVVDAAEELAEMRLAAGDWRGAEWAARQGLAVFPFEERLYRLLMRAAYAAGSMPGVRRVFEELVSRLADPDDGVEPEDTVHPDTVALLEELGRPQPFYAAQQADNPIVGSQ